MKILVVCGHGLGTSLMMEMSIKSILKDLSVTAEVDHRDLASAGSETADIFIATRDIAEQLQSMGVNGRLVSLDNPGAAAGRQPGAAGGAAPAHLLRHHEI